MREFNTFKEKVVSFQHAFQALDESVQAPIVHKRDISGIIKDFELCYEQSLQALTVYLEGEGYRIDAAKDAFEKASKMSVIENEVIWLRIMKDRNLTLETHNRQLAREMAGRIKSVYVPNFAKLVRVLASKEAATSSK